MATSTVLVTSTHPVVLADGRQVNPGEEVEDVDVTETTNRDLVADGHLLVTEGQKVRARGTGSDDPSDKE